MPPRSVVAILLLVASIAGAAEVRFRPPVTAMVDLIGDFPPGEAVLDVQVEVPSTAPADLRIGAYAIADDGGWRQSASFARLPAGTNRIALRVPGRSGSGPRHGAVAGVQFCSASSAEVCMQVRLVEIRPVRSGSQKLLDLVWDGERDGGAHAIAGRPWSVRLRPGVPEGFQLAATITGPDSRSWPVAGRSTRQDDGWMLAFTPPGPGRYQIRMQAGWLGREPMLIEHWLEVTGSSPTGACSPRTAGGRVLRLIAPLRTCLSEPVADPSAALRITAILRAGPDVPDDAVVAGFASDGMGGWRQSPRALPLRPGDNRIACSVPAAPSAYVSEDRPGMAGLAVWSALPSQAEVHVDDFAIAPEPAATQTSPGPCLDQLRLDGVRHAAGGMSTQAGSTWSATVVPSPSGGGSSPGSFRLEAIVSGRGGSHLVTGRPDGQGGYRVDFHPSIPGGYDVRLVGRWPDGRELTCPLPRLDVAGDHPCRDGNALAVAGPCPVTRVLAAVPTGTAGSIEAIVLVPDGAPADLCVAAFAVDRQDLWFASERPRRLAPGINRFSIPVGPGSGLASVPGGCPFTASTLATMRRCGLTFSTASTAPVGLVCSPLVFRRDDRSPAAPSPRLLDLSIPAAAVTAGERWSASLLPEPFPQNPFDPDEFRIDLLVAAPDGSTRTVPGFYGEDMVSTDRGDREELGRRDGRFSLRFRPQAPGRYRMAVQAVWQGRRTARCDLPPLDVPGPAWDGIAHVDRQDGRFFTADGRFYWPFGPNLRSVWDVRSRDHMGTRLTPDRGSLAYRSYLRRFAAAGANACEIWMSAWNLGLEWRAGWPGYDGIGRYNMANAWRLDRILDEAWSQGMRVNLVINNHGQASDRCDAEWMDNPYNRNLGGPLFAPAQMFSDRAALTGQERLRRYVVGRYADHPAVLAWKLWTEIDLTNGGPALEPWHAAAAKRWRELDGYGHPVATHWCSDFTHPTPEVARLVDVVCIDAYHEDDPRKPYTLVNRLLRDSTVLPGRGLGWLGKPSLVTEYGGSPVGTRTDALMAVDHAVGVWTAFVSGHAGGPMLWWFEWIDQGGRFAPYAAIRRFIADEDLRGDGRAAEVRAEPAAIWSGAWRTRTRLYGYAIDERWARDGRSAVFVAAQLNCIDGWPAGPVSCEWWDPDTGRIVDIQRLQHPGGKLRLSAPAFKRHIAWKLRP